MNLKNKYAVIIIRTLFGLMFMFSGISGLASGSDLQGVPEPMVPVLRVLLTTGLFQMIKLTEVIAGAMLTVGFLPALAAIFLAPVCIGIIVFNAHVAPMYVISGVVVSLFNVYMGYVYWDKYKALFSRT